MPGDAGGSACRTAKSDPLWPCAICYKNPPGAITVIAASTAMAVAATLEAREALVGRLSTEHADGLASTAEMQSGPRCR